MLTPDVLFPPGVFQTVVQKSRRTFHSTISLMLHCLPRRLFLFYIFRSIPARYIQSAVCAICCFPQLFWPGTIKQSSGWSRPQTRRRFFPGQNQVSHLWWFRTCNHPLPIHLLFFCFLIESDFVTHKVFCTQFSDLFLDLRNVVGVFVWTNSQRLKRLWNFAEK